MVDAASGVKLDVRSVPAVATEAAIGTARLVVTATGPSGGALGFAAASVAAKGGSRSSTEKVVRESSDAPTATPDPAPPVGKQKTYQAYVKPSYVKPSVTGGKPYAGRTSGTGPPEQNVARRDAGHHLNEDEFGPAVLDKSSSNRDAIRGREQQLIEANGGARSTGGDSGNAINGISERNPRRAEMLEAAKREFPEPEVEISE